MPSAVAIVAMIQAVAEAISAFFAWLNTEEGRVFSRQAMADRKAWDTFWKDAGTQIGRFFRGELFK